MRRLVLLILVAAVALAGCSQKPGPTSLTVSASGGKVSPGWDYAGSDVRAAQATLAGSLDDATNKGNITVAFDFHGAKWKAVFDSFAETKPFMNGGIRFGFDEHGDTQNGDASLPKIHVKAAAWGTASLLKDDVPVVGKASPLWSAHLMLSEDTVRGSDGKILNAAGSAPYDPTKPTDAKITKGTPQAFFYVKSPDGETAKHDPVNGTKTLAFAGPETTSKVDVPAERGAEAMVINVTVSGAQSTPVLAGQLTLTLKDAQGNVTKTIQLTVAPNAPTTAAFEVAGKDIMGPYSLEAKGTGAFSVKVDYAVTFDDHPFLVVTWDAFTAT